MPRITLVLIAIASLISACGAATSSVTLSEPETCERSGGVWRPALGGCDRSGAGGGGGGGY
jgi:hypothetical protein